MCGIAGWYSNKNIKNKKSVIKNMTKTLKRRGNDQKGYYIDDNIMLGHRRLAIVDISKGVQPMSYDNYVIVYNGELYNTLEVKNKLLNDFSFDTFSDTEVLLKGFMKYREKILDMIEGIYAFAIYNKNDGELFLARDRFGVKPLFYTLVDDNLIFASEIKGVLKHYLVKPVVDINSLRELLTFSPSRVIGSGVFKDIYEVKPGHYMVYSSGNLVSKRYWNLINSKCDDSYETAVDKVRDMLMDSITRQMVGDKKVSCLLSGGLDSSIITAVCSNNYLKNNIKLDTYSIDYKDNDKYFKGNRFQVSRDGSFIQSMINRYKTNHKFLVIKRGKLAKLLKYSVYARDLPGMADIDSSLYWMSKKIRKRNKVVLSGECADEIFGGYPWFYNKDISSRCVFPWMDGVGGRISLINKDLVDRLRIDEFLDITYNTIINDSGVELSDEYKRLFYLNMVMFMPTLLERKDRMTMYASLEARVPFADTKLIEYLWNLPFDYKYHDGVEKGILRDAFKDILPDDIYSRKKNPYPKTFDPNYAKIVAKMLKKRFKNKKSILHVIFDDDTINNLIRTRGESYQEPWFGQLMTGPQLMAYLYQIDEWAKKYKIFLDI